MAHDEYEDMSRRARNQNKDLVLAPGEYAYMQELTKGTVRVLVGPTVFSPTAQDQPVRFVMKGDKPFVACGPEDAVQKAAIAVEGMYLQLLNPAQDGKQPSPGRHDTTPDLDVGRKVNIPGPVMFPLWPGQSARLIKGHTMRSNQYLLVRVYNEEEARDNWSKAVVKPAGDEIEDAPTTVTGGTPSDLTVGKQYIIRGTEVSFYIPPTGVTVVPDEDGNYVRAALTLERLEYCILVNEQGDKRYEKGPAVVFPEPNERFITSPKGDKKFRAIELNPIQGIYVKVISDYKDGDVQRKAGEELFITGTETPIYFPREEHSLIKYDNKTKHYATAIPAGEGRYVMDRMTGEIDVVRGPAMELPDPRSRVFVHRVLTERECKLWYPGNDEALTYNLQLNDLQKASPHTRGAISDGELRRAAKKLQSKGIKSGPAGEAFFADQTVLGNSAQSFMPDEFSRGSTYTSPRTITLNTKYQGVPVVCPYTGYAVQVVTASGERRTVLGPARMLMGYDESLEVLSLSTGKPKTTDRVLETVYLRVKNNKISDVVTVETADHVKVSFKLSFLADFEGETAEERQRWFEVENYVKLLCDHVRSVMAGAAKRQTIANLYSNAVDFVRDTILGEKGEGARKGLFFAECGLRVRDVEILDVLIQNMDIAHMLDQEQHAVVSENIQLERERRKLTFTQEHQNIQRKIQEENFETTRLSNELAAKKAALELELVLAKINNEVTTYTERAKSFEAEAAAEGVRANAELDRERAKASQRLDIQRREQDLRIAGLQAEAEAILRKTEKFGPEFTAALTTLSTNQSMEQIAQALSAQQLIGGKDVVEVFQQVFRGFPGMESYLKSRGLEALAAAPQTKPPRLGSNK